MVEVFLIALMVLLVKGMPGGSRITLHLGTYAFAVSVLLGLAANHASERGDVQHLEII